jgi:hypothetical protein
MLRRFRRLLQGPAVVVMMQQLPRFWQRLVAGGTEVVVVPVWW